MGQTAMTAGNDDRRALRIALLGAESTGKTQLAAELADHLRRQGKSVTVVPEYLREWVVREGRTPRPEEQMPIAQEQEKRLDAAAGAAEIVIADTTALMVAIYSAMLFEDGALYRFAQERQRTYDLTLVTGLDLPWVADGLQREGPHVRGAVDTLLRDALRAAQVDFRVIYGSGADRLASALAAIGPFIGADAPAPTETSPAVQPSWTWYCDKCSDPECEHRLFSRLAGRRY
jgi:nicotinamide riboside kinase